MFKTLDDFKAYIQNKIVAVVGLGISNTPLLNFLRSCGAKKITARDKKENIEKTDGIFYILGENYLDDLNEDIIFKTPGIRRDLPQFKDAVNSGSLLTCEMELFFMLCPAVTVAVTGSEGKTTTTTIIGEILKAGGKTVHVGGNIGEPLLSKIETIKKDDYAVVELSSFQLFDLDNGNFAPDYAVITNITPNHLDWHKDMEEYIAAKKIIYKNQKETDRLVLSFDNEITHSIKCGASTVFFSANILPGGVYFDGKSIYAGGKKILDKSDIFMQGAHNILNYMAAIGVTHDIVAREAIVSAAQNIKGIEHRIEYVRNFGGVAYYNSSIDSSPTRTIAALCSFESDAPNIIVILGGSDKKISFEPLAPAVHAKTKAAVLYGETKEKIKQCLDGYKNGGLTIKVSDSFDAAVSEAKNLAGDGDIVLLSPACASLDCFKNFEERGARFKDLVKGF